MFLDDKHYFENSIKTIFNKLNYSKHKQIDTPEQTINFNTLDTLFLPNQTINSILKMKMIIIVNILILEDY